MVCNGENEEECRIVVDEFVMVLADRAKAG
jgi:hypothetical protein